MKKYADNYEYAEYKDNMLIELDNYKIFKDKLEESI